MAKISVKSADEVPEKKPVAESKAESITVKKQKPVQPAATKTEEPPKQPVSRTVEPKAIPSPPPVKDLLPISNPPLTKRKINKLLLILLLLALVIGAGAWFLKLKVPADKAVAAKVSSLAAVPANETPVITTITDKEKVSQAFLKESENGDHLVIYPKARKAVIYRQSTNKIVAIGPMQTAPPAIFIRNGTKQTDSQPLIKKLQEAPEEYRILSQDNSGKSYEKSVVVDISGGLRQEEAATLAKSIGATVSGIPAGESKPDGDLLIIVGNDQFKQ